MFINGSQRQNLVVSLQGYVNVSVSVSVSVNISISVRYFRR